MHVYESESGRDVTYSASYIQKTCDDEDRPLSANKLVYPGNFQQLFYIVLSTKLTPKNNIAKRVELTGLLVITTEDEDFVLMMVDSRVYQIMFIDVMLILSEMVLFL